MAHGRHRWIPFTIASGAPRSGAIDLGPTGILLGVSIHGTWTAAKVSFEAYVPESGVITATGIDNAYQDTNASYDAVKDYTGTQISLGNGTDTSAQFVLAGAETGQAEILAGVRYVKVVSGTTGTPVNQAAARSGYLIVRDLR
jgi:hypothetical protein